MGGLEKVGKRRLSTAVQIAHPTSDLCLGQWTKSSIASRAPRIYTVLIEWVNFSVKSISSVLIFLSGKTEKSFIAF